MPKDKRISRCIEDRDPVIISGRSAFLEKAAEGESELEKEYFEKHKNKNGTKGVRCSRRYPVYPGVYDSDRYSYSYYTFDSDGQALESEDFCAHSPVAFCPYCGKMADLWEFAVLKDGISKEVLSDPFLVNRLRYEGTCVSVMKEFFVPLKSVNPKKASSFISRCPNCGADLSAEKKVDMGYKKSAGWLPVGRVTEIEDLVENTCSCRLQRWHISQKAMEILIQLEYKQYHIDASSNEMHSEKFSVEVSVNMESGRTFAGAPTRFWDNNSSSLELTYGTEMFRSPAIFDPVFRRQDIRDAVWDILCKGKGLNKPDSDDFMGLILSNRYGGNAPYIRELYDDLYYTWCSHLDLDTKLKCMEIPYCSLPDIHILLSSLGLPDCTIMRRRVTENPASLPLIMHAWRMGFHSPSLLVSYSSSSITRRQYDEDGYDYGVWPNEDEKARACRFSNELIRLRGESSVFRMFLKELKEYDRDGLAKFLSDCQLMCETCADANIEPNLRGGNLQKIHDDLCLLIKDIGDTGERQQIIYKEEEIALEGKCGSYSFCLPKDTSQFAYFGNVMGNCVASYANLVLRHECIIVFMRKGIKPCACIELRWTTGAGNGEQFVLVQALGRFNKPLEEPVSDGLFAWMTTNNIRDGR